MNPKLQKRLVKLTFGVAFSAFIGYMMKAGDAIEKKIDEHFDEPAAQDNEITE